MKIVIEATEHTTEIDGVPVRHWRGVTEAGVECDVFVHRIAVHNSKDSAEFERALQTMMPPANSIDLRKILP